MAVRVFQSVLIIADDITGANDTAAQFAKLGFSTVTTLDLKQVPELLTKYDVVAVDTESRAMEANQAHEAMLHLGKKIENTKDVLVYKKVDSTLRGNIVPEIKGLCETLKPSLVVFAPAFPKQGRTTVDGIQKVRGVPVDQTYLGRDTRTPVKSSSIPSHFGSAFKGSYCHVLLDEVRSRKIPEIVAGSTVASFDAENDDDLRTIVHSMVDAPEITSIVWAGAAGLAEHVAYSVIVGSREGKPTLMAVGSVSDLTRNQVQMIVDELGARLVPVRVRSLIGDYENERARVLKKVLQAAASGSDTVVTTSHDRDQILESESMASDLGLSTAEFGNTLASNFGEMISSIITSIGPSKFSGLFMTGGDVASSVMKHLGINSIEIKGEIEPGLPLLKHKSMNIVTKAGGFGNTDTLIKISARLKKKGDLSESG